MKGCITLSEMHSLQIKDGLKLCISVCFVLAVHFSTRRRLLLGLQLFELSVILFIVDPNVFMV